MELDYGAMELDKGVVHDEPMKRSKEKEALPEVKPFVDPEEDLELEKLSREEISLTRLVEDKLLDLPDDVRLFLQQTQMIHDILLEEAIRIDEFVKKATANGKAKLLKETSSKGFGYDTVAGQK